MPQRAMVAPLARHPLITNQFKIFWCLPSPRMHDMFLISHYKVVKDILWFKLLYSVNKQSNSQTNMIFEPEQYKGLIRITFGDDDNLLSWDRSSLNNWGKLIRKGWRLIWAMWQVLETDMRCAPCRVALVSNINNMRSSFVSQNVTCLLGPSNI